MYLSFSASRQVIHINLPFIDLYVVCCKNGRYVKSTGMFVTHCSLSSKCILLQILYCFASSYDAFHMFVY